MGILANKSRAGELRKVGRWWTLRWREVQILADGRTKYAWSRMVHIVAAEGLGKLTENQARRTASDNFLSRLDQNVRTPHSDGGAPA